MPSPDRAHPEAHLNHSEDQLLRHLRQRYGHMNEGFDGWQRLDIALRAHRNELAAVLQLESSGGQPAVFQANEEGILVVDWMVQSPRTDMVFDEEALTAIRRNESRTPWANHFKGESVEQFLNKNPALSLLTPELHSFILGLDPGIDSLSSSYVHTPINIREAGKVCVASNRGVELVDALSHDRIRGFRCFVEFKL